jgi:glycosyltransferase involved in cell wall biosynthesis
MSGRTAAVRYVVISPAKDEARHIELTLQSMAAQTVKPAMWVIVDDGSSDATAEIVTRYAASHSFVRLVNHPHAGARRPGSPVVRAFNYGCSRLGGEGYDFIVKLDCDLSFAPDYFERLFARFAEDPQLGIASGIYLESDSAGQWQPVPMPSYHTFGASKVIRRRCFEDIGGFPAAAGWDTVDEIRAWNLGWRTAHFVDLPARHHKPEGSGIGQLRTSRMHGEIYYTTGGDPLFLLFKILHRLSATPVFMSAAALTFGYLRALMTRKPRLVTRAEARAYRRVLRQRLFRRPIHQAALQPLSSDH